MKLRNIWFIRLRIVVGTKIPSFSEDYHDVFKKFIHFSWGFPGCFQFFTLVLVSVISLSFAGFFPIRSQLAYFSRFWFCVKRRKYLRLEPTSFRTAVHCSTHCHCRWESVFYVKCQPNEILQRFLYSVCASAAKHSFSSVFQIRQFSDDWFTASIFTIFEIGTLGGSKYY